MSTRVRRKFSGPSGILTVSTFLYNLSLSFILGSFCPRRRSGCSPAEKSRFLCICSTGTAVPVPFRSLLFSPFIFPFYGTAAFCSSLHFFTQTPQSCISKIRSFGGGALKKIRTAPAAISSETVPQLYFPPKRAEWYCHKAAQPFCIVLTSLFLLITIL